MMLGLAAITFVLGITYWLIRERDDRLLLSNKGRNPSLPSHPQRQGGKYFMTKVVSELAWDLERKAVAYYRDGAEHRGQQRSAAV
jgi:hypothetical protein